MPAKDIRKVLSEKGHVTLPKPLRDYHGIKKGDEVEMIYDSVIVIIPKGVKLDEEKRKALKKLLE